MFCKRRDSYHFSQGRTGFTPPTAVCTTLAAQPTFEVERRSVQIS